MLFLHGYAVWRHVDIDIFLHIDLQPFHSPFQEAKEAEASHLFIDETSIAKVNEKFVAQYIESFESSQIVLLVSGSGSLQSGAGLCGNETELIDLAREEPSKVKRLVTK